MPLSEEGLSFFVFARDDLSGWVEGRPVINANVTPNYINHLTGNKSANWYEYILTFHLTAPRLRQEGWANYALTMSSMLSSVIPSFSNKYILG